ncbi:hypothetical protein L6164_013651 [Bauhinia variegata]|uniref:Uncharacterized protein n=1 Tax=Bauhinia variegata TaxID=167791 RepID=A0ACB9NFD2_BAUVA|nr:hypothetical protein L6164_013651 [Bauhinia variegata]
MACFIKCGSTIIGASSGFLEGSEDVMSLFVGDDTDGHPQIYSKFPARGPWQNILLAHEPRRRRIPVEDATSSSFQRSSNVGHGASASKSRPSNPVTVAAAHESQNGKYSSSNSSTGLREITLT